MSDNITVIKPLEGPMHGSTRVPGDKSISHRAVLFSAMAEGTSRVSGVLDSADVRSSIGAVRAWRPGQPGEAGRRKPCRRHHRLGRRRSQPARRARGLRQLRHHGAPAHGHPGAVGYPGHAHGRFLVVQAPDAPHHRASHEDGRTLPSRRPRDAAHHRPRRRAAPPHLRCPMASAQLKTAVLLAGMYASGTTTVNEPAPSRNHTELMLPEYGVATTAGACTASVAGPAQPQAGEVLVPGDPSSAAFLACAAVLRPRKLDPDRGCQPEHGPHRLRAHARAHGRPGQRRAHGCGGQGTLRHHRGLLYARSARLRGAGRQDRRHYRRDPVLALVAAHAHGITVFRQVGELRVKETDRLAAIMDGLAKLGVDTWCEGDDLYVEGQPGLQVPEGLEFDSLGDHRLAMTWSLVGLTGKGPVNIKDFEAVCVSYPGFLDDIERLAR